ncbi:MAG: alanyl-tRNA editing protein [Candidatus Woesearchaeota archaeon]
MTELLYLNDSYLKEWNAKIISVKENDKGNFFVTLDKTAFYPNGGGQPWDEGFLVRKSDGKKFRVVFVGKFSDEISHEVSPCSENYPCSEKNDVNNETADAGSEDWHLKEGDEVACKLDWDRRYKLMRSHTAAHIVSTIFNTETGAKITGNQIALEKIRVDYNLEDYDPEKMKVLLEKANEIVEQDLKVSNYDITREKAEKDESLCKLAKGLPEGIKEIRIVKISGGNGSADGLDDNSDCFDKQADAGTHVRFTKEVGKIKFLKCDNKGKNNRRLYFELE